jgi:flagellar biosynthetic protein FliR
LELPLGIALNDFSLFLLVLTRVTGLFAAAPVFGRANLPAYFKIGFAFLFAMILTNTVTGTVIAGYESVYGFAFLIVKEFLVGIALGFVANMLFTAIYVAGQLIDMQIGFGVVNVLDPISSIQVPITANFYFIMSMMIFLSVRGHHVLVRAMFDSFNYLPIGSAVFDGQFQMGNVARLFGEVFILGFRIAAPVTAAILISDVALGVLSRTVPQLNVFIVRPSFYPYRRLQQFFYPTDPLSALQYPHPHLLSAGFRKYS